MSAPERTKHPKQERGNESGGLPSLGMPPSVQPPVSAKGARLLGGYF